MLAGLITGVPKRIYTCRGFRFEHESGALLRLLVFLEKVTSFCSHRVYCISKSVRDLGVSMNIFPIEKTRLIAHGSSNGVDLALFSREHIDQKTRSNLVAQYGLNDKFVFGFVGRIVDRKGIRELYEAFDTVYNEQPYTRLLVVGRPFWDQIKDKTVIDKLEKHQGIIMTGFQKIEMVPYFLSVMDVFLLPAHWEGFGNVLIQAAAMGVPIIATDVTGCKDAVSGGFNGILVPPNEPEQLVDAMRRMIKDSEMRKSMGEHGIVWSKYFTPEIIWDGYEQLYEEV
jgi:glycosyltransferase involved in cell wall biosynthesis